MSVPLFSQAFALGFAAILHQLRREAPATGEQAEAAIVLSTEQGFPFWSAWGTIPQGWALAEQCQEAEGIVKIHQGLVSSRSRPTAGDSESASAPSEQEPRVPAPTSAPLYPNRQPATRPSIWPSASWPNKRRWNRAAQPTLAGVP